jgi:type I restriction enzyme S subunit
MSYDLHRLNEVIEFIVDNRGKTPPHNDVEGYPLIEVNAVSSNNKYPDMKVIRKYVNEDVYENWFRKGHPLKGDILIPTVGTIGPVGYYNNDNACIAQNLIALRVNKDLCHSEYLYYYLTDTTTLKRLMNLDIGGVQPSIKVPHLMNIEVKLPSLPKQKAIANILSSLDEKIELNNKINKNLEEMAQALYIQWFVDFEFPNEDGEPYKSSGGEMVESELGLIPKGWEVGTIGDYLETSLGGTPSRKKKEYWNGNINWINSGKINDFRIISESEKITDLGLSKSSTKLLPRKTTVLAITGATLGQTSLLEIDSCSNQSVIGVLENDEVPYSYIFPMIQNEIDNLTSRQTGGAQQHINKNDVNSYMMIKPQKSVLIKFHQLTSIIYDKIAVNLFENKSIEDTRDTLLPKLMSGEIEVPIEG